VDFVTLAIDLDAIVTPRTEPGPLFDVKLSEILDFLAETGERMRRDEHGYLASCVDHMSATNVLPRRLIELMMRFAADYLDKNKLREYAERNIGDIRLLDEWVPSVDSAGRHSYTRAFPPRLVHLLPGNSPVAAIQSIVATNASGIRQVQGWSSHCPPPKIRGDGQQRGLKSPARVPAIMPRAAEL
jgi:hypothetical protein